MSNARKIADLLDSSGDVLLTNLDNTSLYVKPSSEPINYIVGLQTALDTKTTPGYVDSAVAGIVDSAPATLNTLNELALALGDDANHVTTMTNLIGTKLPLAGGTLTGATNFIDSAVLSFGYSGDLQIYHDGFNSYIKDDGTGGLKIQGRDSITLEDGTTGENYIYCQRDGKVELSHNGIPKLATTSTGVDVTGSVTCDDIILNNTATIDFPRTAGVASLDYTDGSPAAIWMSAATTTNYYQPLIGVGEGTGTFTAAISSVDNGTGAAQGLAFHTGDTNAITERLRILSNGNVGIGTITPTAKLHISSGNGALLQLAATNAGTPENWMEWYDTRGRTGYIGYHSNGNDDFVVVNEKAGSIKLYTNNTERMRIDSSGNVGVGITNPSRRFEVVHSSTNMAKFTGATNAYVDFTDGNVLGRIQMSGNLYFGTETANHTVNFKVGGNVRATLHNTGLDVTGSVTCDGLTVDGNLSIPNNNQLKFKYSTIAEDIYDADSLCLRADITENIIFGRGVEESMRIDSTGKVGIGVSSPIKTLDIRTDDGIYVRGKTGTVDGKISLQPASGGRQIDLRTVGSSFEMYDASANSSKMYWHYNGNVGIGVGTSPSQKLDVAGVIKAQDLLIRGTVGGAESEAIYYGSQMRVHHDGQTCSDGLTRIAVGRAAPALAIKNTGTNPALHIQGGVLKFPDGTTMSTAATTLSYTAPAYDGGWVLYEDDTSSVVAGFDVSIDWKTVKKFVVDKPGSIRVTYEAYVTSGQRYFAIRAYSAATGTVHNIHAYATDLAPGVTSSVHAYREFSYVINNLNAGDLIELQGVTTPGNTAPILSTSSQPLYMKALKLRANEPATVINGVNISEAYWDGSSTTPSPNTLGAGMEINGTTIGAHFDRGLSYDAYIKLTNMPTDDFTLDFMFYITSNVVHSQTDPAGLLWFNTDVASFTAVHYNDSTIKLGGGGWFSGGYDYAKSGQGWWRVTISKSGDTWKYWVEGNLVYTENLPSSSVTSTWWFSNYSAHGGNSNNHYHRGYIDEIKVYASASIAETL